MKKRGISLVLMLLFVTALAVPSYAAPAGADTNVRLVVDGQDLTDGFSEDTLWLENGITMVGVRALGESLGGQRPV